MAPMIGDRMSRLNGAKFKTNQFQFVEQEKRAPIHQLCIPWDLLHRNK